MNTLAPSSRMPDDDESIPAFDRDFGKRALDELYFLTSRYRQRDSLLALMQFVSRFRRYSPYNAMLVHIQKPGAKYVSPASRWLKDYGRHIMPHAQALVILQPMGPVMFVFDVSETEGRSLPQEIENPFDVVARQSVASELDRTISNAARDGVRVHRRPYGSLQAGQIGRATARTVKLKFREQTVPLHYDLVLHSGHKPAQQYGTLVHELAHLYCGHQGTPNPKWWPDRRGLSKETREFEAESVAYLVCQRLGLDLYSAEYLSGYLADKAEPPPVSLELILKAAGLIEQMGRENLTLRKASA